MTTGGGDGRAGAPLLDRRRGTRGEGETHAAFVRVCACISRDKREIRLFVCIISHARARLLKDFVTRNWKKVGKKSAHFIIKKRIHREKLPRRDERRKEWRKERAFFCRRCR